MTTHRRTAVAFISSLGVTTYSILLIGCSTPTMPQENPRDPLSAAYEMIVPIFEDIPFIDNRLVLIRYHSIDPYATYIQIERQDGPGAPFILVCRMEVTRDLFIDAIPFTPVTEYWYRGRFETKTGIMGAYSAPKLVHVPGWYAPKERRSDPPMLAAHGNRVGVEMVPLFDVVGDDP
jgi:hypothetical protein